MAAGGLGAGVLPVLVGRAGGLRLGFRFGFAVAARARAVARGGRLHLVGALAAGVGRGLAVGVVAVLVVPVLDQRARAALAALVERRLASASGLRLGGDLRVRLVVRLALLARVEADRLDVRPRRAARVDEHRLVGAARVVGPAHAVAELRALRDQAAAPGPLEDPAEPLLRAERGVDVVDPVAALPSRLAAARGGGSPSGFRHGSSSLTLGPLFFRPRGTRSEPAVTVAAMRVLQSLTLCQEFI